MGAEGVARVQDGQGLGVDLPACAEELWAEVEGREEVGA